MRRILTFWLVAVATLLLTSWLLNAPILRYVQQQHYATNYPYLAFFDELTTIPDNAFFDFGNRIKNSPLPQKTSPSSLPLRCYPR